MPREPITSAGFDPHAMLAKALAGAYPAAGRRSKHRGDEIAYWRQRCGLPADAPAAAHPDEAPADAPPSDDAAFLELAPAERRAAAWNYLTSLSEADQATGRHLCRLAGLDPVIEAQAAREAQAASLERFQRRARMAARVGRAGAAPAAASLFWEGADA